MNVKKINDFINSLKNVYSIGDRDLILKAYEFAEKAHAGQKRFSGEPYINHCSAVALILANLRVPPEVIVAGLLHDTVEDTKVTLDIIREKFGAEVATLVDGVTKLKHLPGVSKDDLPENPELITKDRRGINETKSRKRDLATETLRKTLMAMGEDIRVILIKLADRLHNMRTLDHLPQSRQVDISKETMDIFAPLANRLGIWQIKWELEDLSFRHLHPNDYRDVAAKLADRRINREEEIQQIIKDLIKIMQDGEIQADISGRPKHIYSIYRKMKDKGEPFELVRDLRAVRLIVPDIPSCYSALGLIHTNWRPIPNEFDDYIAAPKDNFYQSLHTAVLYSDGKPLEVQIRTQEMHENAEYGIAAHWRYKEKKHLDASYEQRINWLRKIMEWRQDVEDAQEFVEGMKTDVFEDRVFIFTPRGDIIDLPAGSTPIDFAYHVHTEIGHRCRGAKINGKLITLDHKLKTGDLVEILTAKHGGPSRDWLNPHLNLIKTERARTKIRQWFKIQNRDLNLNQGKALLEKEIRRLGLIDINLEELAKTFDFKSEEDLFVGLGCGDLSVHRIINKLREVSPTSQDPLFTTRTITPEKTDESAVRVLGLKGILFNYARCCNPAPGDEIVGYITRGRGATIHRKDCPNILRTKERERIVKVNWGEPKQTFPVSIQVKAYDRQGLMGDISTILNNEGINMRDISVNLSDNFATITLILDISDITQLSRVLTIIETLPNVMDTYRIKPG